MRRIEHITKPERSTCERVATIVLRRRGVFWDTKKHRVIADALLDGYQFDERGMPMSETVATSDPCDSG